MRIKLKERDMNKANIKIDCLLWQRKELLKMYRDECDKCDSALDDARQLRKELKRRQEIHQMSQTISKDKLEYILRHFYDVAEVEITNILVGTDPTEKTLIDPNSLELEFKYERKKK